MSSTDGSNYLSLIWPTCRKLRLSCGRVLPDSRNLTGFSYLTFICSFLVLNHNRYVLCCFFCATVLCDLFLNAGYKCGYLLICQTCVMYRNSVPANTQKLIWDHYYRKTTVGLFTSDVIHSNASTPLVFKWHVVCHKLIRGWEAECESCTVYSRDDICCFAIGTLMT